MVSQSSFGVRTDFRRSKSVKKWMLIAPAAMLFAGCFATQKDVQVLQGDISLMRSERLAADSARSRQLDRAIASVRVANDSLVALSTRLTRFRSDMTMSMSSVQQELLQVQVLTGQSQQRIQEVSYTHLRAHETGRNLV